MNKNFQPGDKVKTFIGIGTFIQFDKDLPEKFGWVQFGDDRPIPLRLRFIRPLKTKDKSHRLTKIFK